MLWRRQFLILGLQRGVTPALTTVGKDDMCPDFNSETKATALQLWERAGRCGGSARSNAAARPGPFVLCDPASPRGSLGSGTELSRLEAACY